MLNVPAARFDGLVAEALSELPPEFEEHMENVTVVIDPEPSREQLLSVGYEPDDPEATLLGLYEGVPLTDRGIDGVLLPDTITIFRGPLLRMCRSEAELVRQVRITVLHEVGHFFGMDEDRLDELGYS